MTPLTHRAEHPPASRPQPIGRHARQPRGARRSRTPGMLRVGWTCLGSAAAALIFAGCAPDLGDCDPTMLGGSETGTLAPHTGQLLLANSCAAGRCHAESAKGESRKGAPAGLNFGVVPASNSEEDLAAARRSSGVVSNHSLDIWDEVEAGTMPPPKPAGAGALAPSQKEILRNWLACGAPVVEAPPTADPNADAWTKIYTQLSGSCAGCHSAATAATAGGGFEFGEASTEASAVCAAHYNVVGVATSASGACSGKRIVTASEPDNSVLLVKLTGANLCGSLMPLGSPTPFEMSHTQLVADLRAWIMSGAKPPAGCSNQ